MDAERILTLHPRGLAGTRIDADKYEFIRDEILVRLGEHEQSFMELARQMTHDLQDTFDGSVMWYATTVKLDL